MKGRFSAILIALVSLAVGHPGNGIVALSANAVLTGDAVHNGLWRFELGKAPRKLTERLRFHCHWVTKGLDGRLYAETLSKSAARWDDTVYVLDAQGAHPIEVDQGPEGTFGVFAVGRSGEIVRRKGQRIVARVKGVEQPFRGSGRVADGSPALGAVKAFAWGPDDDLYLVDGPYVRRIGQDGVVRLVVELKGTVSDRLYAANDGGPMAWGIAIDSKRRIVVALPSNGQVLRIETGGKQTVLARSESGWEAIGVAVHGETVFLLESKTEKNANFGPRVRAIRPDGRIELLGTAG